MTYTPRTDSVISFLWWWSNSFISREQFYPCRQFDWTQYSKAIAVHVIWLHQLGGTRKWVTDDKVSRLFTDTDQQLVRIRRHDCLIVNTFSIGWRRCCRRRCRLYSFNWRIKEWNSDFHIFHILFRRRNSNSQNRQNFVDLLISRYSGPLIQ